MRTLKMEMRGHRKIKRPKLRWSDVIRRHEGDRSTERRRAILENMDNIWKLDMPTPNSDKAREDVEAI